MDAGNVLNTNQNESVFMRRRKQFVQAIEESDVFDQPDFVWDQKNNCTHVLQSIELKQKP